MSRINVASILVNFLLLLAHAKSQAIKNAKNLQVRDDVTWKVVGGSAAGNGQFPYIVSLRDASNRHFCGGSIINEHCILTAAHCMVGVSPSNLLVVAGTNTLTFGGTAYRASEIRIHPYYDGNVQNKNDLAIVHVSPSIAYSSSVQPIRLGTVGGGAVCTLSGWGSVFLGSQSPNALQLINLRSLSTQECQSYLPEVDDSQICTLTAYGQGACHGDSGGPLASNGLLVGVVSYGRPCAKGLPDVFTRVAAHVDWIKGNMY